MEADFYFFFSFICFVWVCVSETHMIKKNWWPSGRAPLSPVGDRGTNPSPPATDFPTTTNFTEAGVRGGGLLLFVITHR